MRANYILWYLAETDLVFAVWGSFAILVYVGTERHIIPVMRVRIVSFLLSMMLGPDPRISNNIRPLNDDREEC